MPRVTITRRHNGRFYLGLDENAAWALIRMVRTGMHYGWATDCMGAAQPEAIIEAGKKVFVAVAQMEEQITQRRQDAKSQKEVTCQ